MRRDRCQLRFGVRWQPLQSADPESGGWRELLVECRRATPDQLAAARIDFQTWLDRLPPRDRKIALLLAAGEETRAVVKEVGVSAGRISQKRRELAASWYALHGLDAEGRETSAAAA